MPSLSVAISDFSGTYASLNGKRSIAVSKRKLLKFAMSIGLPLLRAGSRTSTHAIALSTYKSLALKCAIDFTSTNLRRPAPYERMDPSEKGNISYWTGMALAGLVVDECLGVTRLMHAGAFRRLGRLKTNSRSRRLADLVGQDSAGGWHVIESKARQGAPSAATRADWKIQSGTVNKIDGAQPRTRSYSLVNVARTYSVDLVDPARDKAYTSVDIDFQADAVVKGYYDPVGEWLTEDRGTTTIARERVPLVVRLAGFDPVDGEFLFIGLREDALKVIQHGELPARLESRDLDDTFIGSDGLVIVTSRTQDLE